MVSISQQCDNVSQKKIIAKSVKRTLGEYSQNMTLEDLSTSNSLISIDILMLQKTVVEDSWQFFKSCLGVKNSKTLDSQLVRQVVSQSWLFPVKPFRCKNESRERIDN